MKLKISWQNKNKDDTLYNEKTKKRLEKHTEYCGTDTNSCWLWTGATYGKEYGAITYKNRTTGVHRVAYKLYRDPLFEVHSSGQNAILIQHICGNKKCINPAHLFIKNSSEQKTKRKSTYLFTSEIALLDIFNITYDDLCKILKKNSS